MSQLSTWAWLALMGNDELYGGTYVNVLQLNLGLATLGHERG